MQVQCAVLRLVCMIVSFQYSCRGTLPGTVQTYVPDQIFCLSYQVAPSVTGGAQGGPTKCAPTTCVHSACNRIAINYMVVPPQTAERDEVGNGVLVVYVDYDAAGNIPVFLEAAKADAPLHVTLDFSGSENLSLVGQSGLKLECSVSPGECVLAAELSAIDFNKGWSLVWAARWRAAAPDPARFAAEIKVQASKVDDRIDSMLSIHKKLAAAKQPPFSEAKVREAMRDGAIESHVDAIGFPPSSRSVGMSEAGKRMSWCRPYEFGTDKEIFEVFADGINASDIAQGALANCWFVCALAALVEFPELISSLFTTPWSRDKQESSGASTHDAIGMYELKLSTHGQWRTVFIDDHFPCKPGAKGGPVFTHNHGPEVCHAHAALLRTETDAASYMSTLVRLNPTFPRYQRTSKAVMSTQLPPACPNAAVGLAR